MSDDLDVRGGGVVAVDTVTLERAAAGFAALADELAHIRTLVGSALNQVFAADHALAGSLVGSATDRLDRPVREAMQQSDDLAGDLRRTAAGYESAERTVGQALMQPGILTVQAGAGLAAFSPVLAAWAAAGTYLLAQGVALDGSGRIPRHARLLPVVSEVRVTLLPAPAGAAATAPRDLADAASRIPADRARVRVERYTMPDGARQFAVYISGTRSMAVRGGTEAFDMASNLQLYRGVRSASYSAAAEALHRAGARRGDVVHIAGHSQGAMVGSRLALEGGFAAKTLITLGSPVEADLDDRTLSVALRHRDDPVAALAGGGHADPVGAPGSIVAERTAVPGDVVLDLDAHSAAAYAETAALLDASPDPRMEAVRQLFDELDHAASIDVFEYAAERP
ncbi:hypothetical protein [Microbacterium terricola]|uniref:Alpha/beta hydrolase n=1 Tax=Microbacterium terricola TaxID=344163 RepID=A0ABM8E315_9MICO|nr:hypothetical protein [Microbacterium terricola]UYK39955.1 hypothetical protein OAU46_14875 [Microbacterium terricola]BDV32363.1 hypothetical protein Microterr_30230 [Microbacterium terricola]